MLDKIAHLGFGDTLGDDASSKPSFADVFNAAVNGAAGLATGIATAASGKKDKDPTPDKSGSSGGGGGFLASATKYLPYAAIGLGGLLVFRAMRKRKGRR